MELEGAVLQERKSLLSRIYDFVFKIPFPIRIAVIVITTFIVFHLTHSPSVQKERPTPPPQKNVGHPYYEEFEWTMLEGEICAQDVDVLIVVHSDGSHFERRKAIRDTYASELLWKMARVRTIFAIGRPDELSLKRKLEAESAENRDIIQQDFVESSSNSTIKSLMWLRFVKDFCPKLNFVLKLNDDVAPNMFIILHQRQFLKSVQAHRTITCNTRNGEKVVRDASSKLYVPESAHEGDVWETFCDGDCYLMTTDLVPDIIDQVEKKKEYVQVDDAFLTGMIASEINANRNPIWSEKSNTAPNQTLELLANRKIVYGTYEEPDELRNIWKNLTETYIDSRYELQ